MPQYDADRDLTILVAMAEQIQPYLREDQLFWPIYGRVRGGMPRLTLGGFLLRQQRLTELQRTSGLYLDAQQQVLLADATAQWRAVKTMSPVQYNNKILREWAMRTNVLYEFLRDCADVEIHVPLDDWTAQAKQRVMLHLLYQELTEYDGGKAQKTDLARLDSQIRRYLLPGEQGRFLWAAELQPVYPAETFWWLWITPVDQAEA